MLNDLLDKHIDRREEDIAIIITRNINCSKIYEILAAYPKHKIYHISIYLNHDPLSFSEDTSNIPKEVYLYRKKIQFLFAKYVTSNDTEYQKNLKPHSDIFKPYDAICFLDIEDIRFFNCRTFHDVEKKIPST